MADRRDGSQRRVAARRRVAHAWTHRAYVRTVHRPRRRRCDSARRGIGPRSSATRHTVGATPSVGGSDDVQRVTGRVGDRAALGGRHAAARQRDAARRPRRSATARLARRRARVSDCARAPADALGVTAAVDAVTAKPSARITRRRTAARARGVARRTRRRDRIRSTCLQGAASASAQPACSCGAARVAATRGGIGRRLCWDRTNSACAGRDDAGAPCGIGIPCDGAAEHRRERRAGCRGTTAPAPTGAAQPKSAAASS